MEREREKIVKAAKLNRAYMDLPVGNHHPALVKLYREIAEESVIQARNYSGDMRRKPLVVPPGNVCAFWWATAAWAWTLGYFMRDSITEPAAREWTGRWDTHFVAPHVNFASYLTESYNDWRLRALGRPEDLPDLSPADTILELDRRWMWLVINHTRLRDLKGNLKNGRALWEAWRLNRHLKDTRSVVRQHYLEADLVFLRVLFQIFLAEDPDMLSRCSAWLESAGLNSLPPLYAGWAATVLKELDL